MVQWDPPSRANGVIQSYYVNIVKLQPKYHVPFACEHLHYDQNQSYITSELSVTFKEALPFTEYAVEVLAVNNAGSGPKCPVKQVITGSKGICGSLTGV